MQLDKIIDDGKSYSGSRHGPVQPGAACNYLSNALLRNAWSVIFDHNLNRAIILAQNAALGPFSRVVEQVSAQVLQIAVIDWCIDVGGRA